MKIIQITQLTAAADDLAVDFHPDSAVILPGRPLFMPDFGASWQFIPHVAIRINRLGKSISRKFASRYFDGVSIALRLVSPFVGEGILSGMDSSLAFGRWVSIEELQSFEVGGIDIETRLDEALVAEAIHQVSRYCTLKMGDVILLPGLPFPISTVPGTHLRLNIPASEEPLLGLKVV